MQPFTRIASIKKRIHKFSSEGGEGKRCFKRRKTTRKRANVENVFSKKKKFTAVSSIYINRFSQAFRFFFNALKSRDAKFCGRLFIRYGIEREREKRSFFFRLSEKFRIQ